MVRIRTAAAATLLAAGLMLGSTAAADAAPAPKCLTMTGQQVPANIAKLICKDPNQARPLGPGDKPPTADQLRHCAKWALRRSPWAAVGALWCLVDLTRPR